MTIPRLKALNAHWEQHPPTYLLLEALVGYKAPRRATSQEMMEMAARFGGRRIEAPK